MPVYTYRQVRSVLQKLGFELVRSRKHETWEKVLEDGTVLQARLSHKGGRDIPPGTFAEILRQMGIDHDAFVKLL